MEQTCTWIKTVCLSLKYLWYPYQWHQCVEIQTKPYMTENKMLVLFLTQEHWLAFVKELLNKWRTPVHLLSIAYK